MDDLKNYLEERGVEYRRDARVESYLTMGIGGTVRMIVVIHDYSRLKEVLIYLYHNRQRYPFVLLGGGSNVIFPDDFSPLVVIINRASEITREQEENHVLRVNSGVFIGALMAWNTRNNSGGMEFLAGIPGTVGGAAAVNAGAFGRSISEIVAKAEIVARSGEVKTVDNDYFRFTYRDSVFKCGDEVILNVFLKYIDEDGAEIRKKVEEKLNYRKANHPCSGDRSAGCFFKNPVVDGKKISAGRLLEQLGFKGQVYNRLRVSGEHANFIINRGAAVFEDIKSLEDQIVHKMLREKGIKLEREVIYISPDGKKY